MSSLFLRDDLAAVPHEVGDVVALHGDEAKHAVTVNRLRVGQHTSIGDGGGLIVRGPVVGASGAELTIAVTEVTEERMPGPSLWLVQALAKGDRDELAIQAATELGVAGVVPWSADRSVSRWAGAKVAKGVERWRSIVREAAKQSIRAWVPDVAELHSTRDLVKLAATSRMLLLEPTASLALTDFSLDGEDAAADLVLVVGPEGGISAGELDVLTRAGAIPVRLGNTILRTSTAGPAALAVLNARLGRW
ncbi:16S rRNA (uracil(1498)-N(3))-methyltransferase [Subtercola sp. PAMC28395]|uniref:16S rRNA (uracil(1498)-N(3))-methyltransferase n=1 Tax=Subtercola sp. PAMC28395 TaxID=2846775 RepID=UPI001C0A9979|nr:16S rRNA (uracil(1498)-N(3))-methyltransferase [Subtercola sp. PAMC28395]QWT23041.1 16S rRNA (uracil(1498)-N(3))-methyltransferase [Subtercola sp. PAMC28395]